MKVETVGIMSPGDMGSAVGKILRDEGINVITCLEGLSELSQLRAKKANMHNVRTMEQLVCDSDIILSILVPSEALTFSQRISEVFRRTGATSVFADCNAIAPHTVAKIKSMMTDLGITFIDGGIIGPPPRVDKKSTRIYCSGPDTSAMESLNQYGLDVRVVGNKIGQASSLKMVYSASNKGTIALWTELLVAAKVLGVEEALKNEFELSQDVIYEEIIERIPSMPRRAKRWTGEMIEIADTFEGIGMTPRVFLGAHDMYRFISNTPLADQTSLEPDSSLEKALRIFSEQLSL